MPVFIRSPVPAFVRVASFSPLLKLLEKRVLTLFKGVSGHHRSMIIGPSVYLLVQLFDELPLSCMEVLLYHLTKFRCVALYRFFTWCNDGLKTKRRGILVGSP